MWNKQTIESIIDQYLTGALDPQGRQQLRSLLEDGSYEEMLGEVIDQNFARRFSEPGAYHFPEAQQRMKEFILAGIRTNNSKVVRHRVHFLRTAWFRYAAAILLLAGIGAYYFITTNYLPQDSLSRAPLSFPRSGNLTGASHDKAILTLADGTQVILDDKATGNIAQQGNTKIIKLDGNQLAYSQGNNLKNPIGYNTVSTPNGNQYQVILPDGSKVWLNAMSGLRFPTAFTGATRTVEITGEAYLEIVKNTKQPFFVKARGTEVQVLGTSFNINAYSDERSIKTTLIDGSVKVSTSAASELLKPGQQAQVDPINGITLISNPDIADRAIAWKKGLFNFEGLGVKEVMNQLQRWYDIEVVYEGGIPDVTFFGEMDKNVKLSVALEAVKGVGVNFRIEGDRKIIISNK